MKHLNRLLILVVTLTVLVSVSTGAALLGMVRAPAEQVASIDGMLNSFGNIRDWPLRLMPTVTAIRASAGAGPLTGAALLQRLVGVGPASLLQADLHGAALEQIRVRILDRFITNNN